MYFSPTILLGRIRGMLHQNISADFRITLHSGRHFDLADLEAAEISVDDIAHGLAHVCRYAGQCSRFFSVAEHSVLVSQIVPHSEMSALFHDAAEAIIGDMPAPLKRMLPEYKVIETNIERVIFRSIGITWPPPNEVKQADYQVMATELGVLMPPGTNEWIRRANVSPANVELQFLDPAKAKMLFLDRYNELARRNRDHGAQPDTLRLTA